MLAWNSTFNLILSAILALVVSCIMLVRYVVRYDKHHELFGRKSDETSGTSEETGGSGETGGSEMPGYKTIWSPWYIIALPIVMVVLVLGMKFLGLADRDVSLVLGMPIFSLFFSVAVYFLVMVFIIRILRKWLEARTLVILWMLPGILYIRIWQSNDLGAFPVKMFYLPAKVCEVVLMIWAAGAVLVLGWNVYQHRQFKKELFRGARAVLDEDEKSEAGGADEAGEAGKKDAVSEIYESEQAFAELKERILIAWSREVKAVPEKIPTGHMKIYISPNAKTPVSVGVSQTHTKIVLPDRSYSDEELQWILRHEIRHIVNNDCSNKMFMIFCKSIGWFLPQMWCAARYAAEDIELGCDESVLTHASSSTRRYYAGLLLQTAGDGRGFTTCLSASGVSMRYRLKHVVDPSKVHPVLNILVVGIISFLLMFSYGMVGIATSRETIADAFISGNLEDYTITAYEYQNEDYDHKIPIDTDTVIEYLNTTYVSEVYGRDFDGYEDDSWEWDVELDGPKYYELTITDRSIIGYGYIYDDFNRICYYVY